MEEKTVVLYPGLAVSHFVPMMQLADALLEHGYAVSVALIDPAVKEDIAFVAVVGRVASSKPSVRFHTLPRVQDPPVLTHDAQFLLRYLDLVSRYNERLHDLLCSMRTRRRVHAVIVDSLSAEALTVTKKLGIPGYTLFTAGAATLAAFVQLPSVLAEGQTSFKELGDTSLELFGLPPMPASHLLDEMLEDPESDTYKVTMNALNRIPEANGVLVNTFESLEARAVAALRDPRCLPGRVLPPVYCVGPLVGGSGEAKERHECLAWLDGQPDRSVAFLCFGSTGAGSHSEEQLKEIAVGLEKSGHRFLWVVRAPPRRRPGEAIRPPRRPGPRRPPAGRVLRSHPRPRARRQAVGAAGRRAPPQGNRGVRDALRVELGSGGRHRGGADAVLAAVRGAEDEQAAHGGGDEGRRGDGRVATGAGQGRRGGGQVEAGHGVPRRQGAQGAGGGAQGRRGRGLEGRRLVARGVCPVVVGHGQPTASILTAVAAGKLSMWA